MVGDATACRGSSPSAGPSSSGTGTEPVATAWATTMTPPSAPTVSTAAVAAVVVQSTVGERLTRASIGGRTRSRKYDSPTSTSDGVMYCEDTDPRSLSGSSRQAHGPTR